MRAATTGGGGGGGCRRPARAGSDWAGAVDAVCGRRHCRLCAPRRVIQTPRGVRALGRAAKEKDRSTRDWGRCSGAGTCGRRPRRPPSRDRRPAAVPAPRGPRAGHPHALPRRRAHGRVAVLWWGRGGAAPALRRGASWRRPALRRARGSCQRRRPRAGVHAHDQPGGGNRRECRPRGGRPATVTGVGDGARATGGGPDPAACRQRGAARPVCGVDGGSGATAGGGWWQGAAGGHRGCGRDGPRSGRVCWRAAGLGKGLREAVRCGAVCVPGDG